MVAFERLQKKLVQQWEVIQSSIAETYDERHTLVVVPSINVDVELTSSAMQAYEERMLFMLFLLRKPGIRIIYCTSQTIHSHIIDYYLELLPGVIGNHARKQLFLISPEDGSPAPLSEKLLKRTHLLKKIQSLVTDPDRAHIVPFHTTDLERDLALALQLPMYAADPRHEFFGTKSGCRHIFEDENVLHPLGVEDLFSVEAVIQSIQTIRVKRPHVQHVVVKLNEGVSGLGNALVTLTDLPPAGSADERTAIQDCLYNLQLEGEDIDYTLYMDKLCEHGGIVEEYITGVEIHSPSVQLRLSPLGDVELLSTHDQLLGGPSGQSYLGALFPANTEYSQMIVQDAIKIGERLAKEGVLGRFAVDFVVCKNTDGSWTSYAIEINLRKGGTTAPFLVLQYLTDGDYDGETGIFTTASGHRKCYVSSDHIESPAYHAFTTDDLFDIVSTERLHYNHATQTGIVMHMITGVGELGRVGATAIANSHDEARTLYDRFVATLDAAAAKLID